MLTYRLLRNRAGILLAGDYHSLDVLRSAVHQVNEKSPIVRDKEGVFLALAYDARKAIEGQRQVLKPPAGRPEIGVRYGVESLWPTLLLQSRMLRDSLAYLPATLELQAITYALEAVIEYAVQADFGAEAPAILHQWERLRPGHPYAEEHFHSRGGIFCSWKKGERQKRLAGLLASLDGMYAANYPIWTANGAPNLLVPSAYDAWADAEWPDPHW